MSTMHPVTEKFRHSLIRWQFFKPQEPLLVAVSGGIDSMVLLHLLQHLPLPRRPRLTVLHFNHHLRGRESDGEERFVRSYCLREQLPCVVGRSRPWRSKENLQERAREARYRFFQEQSRKRRIFTLATAHQADDQTESFLMRWIQGAGLKGLSGIPMRRQEGSLQMVRPLLLISRAEICAYARHFKIPYREDSSNRSDKYLRNKIRFLVRRLKSVNPQLAQRSTLNALFLQADEAYLDEAAERMVKKLSGGCWMTRSYLKLPRALRWRCLQKQFQWVQGGVLSGEHILKLDELLQSREGTSEYHLPHGVLFRKKQGKFTLISP